MRMVLRERVRWLHRRRGRCCTHWGSGCTSITPTTWCPAWPRTTMSRGISQPLRRPPAATLSRCLRCSCPSQASHCESGVEFHLVFKSETDVDRQYSWTDRVVCCMAEHPCPRDHHGCADQNHPETRNPQWEHACCLHLLDLSSTALIPFLVHVHTAVPSLSSPSCDCSSSIKSCSMRSLL